MMPPLTGLGIGRIVIFYIYAAPTALLAEILRLRNVQTPGGIPLKGFRLKAPGCSRKQRSAASYLGLSDAMFLNLDEEVAPTG